MVPGNQRRKELTKIKRASEVVGARYVLLPGVPQGGIVGLSLFPTCVRLLFLKLFVDDTNL